MGSGDQVPDALRRMGVDVTLIDDDMLATGDLSRFDTIVVGVRASEARPDFVANHGRLLRVHGARRHADRAVPADRLRRAQPAAVSGADRRATPRVTDETAPVDDPRARAIRCSRFPNRDHGGRLRRLGAGAQSLRVRARSTRATRRCSRRPILARRRSAAARCTRDVGKGRYVYTSYAWFRQLPAGVPGAYRQFANLVSLSKAPRVSVGTRFQREFEVIEGVAEPPLRRTAERRDSRRIFATCRPASSPCSRLRSTLPRSRVLTSSGYAVRANSEERRLGEAAVGVGPAEAPRPRAQRSRRSPRTPGTRPASSAAATRLGGCCSGRCPETRRG